MRHEHLMKPTRVQVCHEARRSWRSLWRKQPRWETVWVGTITSWSQDMGGSRIELQDSFELLRSKQIDPKLKLGTTLKPW